MTITRDCPKPHAIVPNPTSPCKETLTRHPGSLPHGALGALQWGHHPKEMKLLRTTVTSPFSMCPRVKNTSELPLPTARSSSCPNHPRRSRRPGQLTPASSARTGPCRPVQEELMGDQLWLIAEAPKFSPSLRHPGGIVNLRAVFNKTKATWNYMQVWFSTVHIYLIS